MRAIYRLAILSALVLVASCATRSTQVPLPEGITIVPPAAGLPKELAAFSGRWRGVWFGALESVLIIEQIDSQRAAVLYAWGDAPTVYTTQGFQRYRGTVLQGQRGVIEFANRDVRFTAEMSEDLASIRVTRSGGYRALVETFTRISNPAASSSPGSDAASASVSPTPSRTDAAAIRREANAAPPSNLDRQELTAFHHKRGDARYRLGDYPAAIADLKRALELYDSYHVSQRGWGNRWRIQTDLGRTQVSAGKWFDEIELWTRVAADRETSPNEYQTAATRIAFAQASLGNLAEAEKVLNEANATFTRHQPEWLFHDSESTNQAFNAWFMELQGNYAEAERLYRLALESAENSLAKARRALPEGHQSLRTQRETVAARKRRLADVLTIRNKPGEAELYARAALREQLDYVGFNTVEVSTTYAVVASAKMQQGELGAAREYATRSLEALQGSGAPANSTLLATERGTLANVLLLQSRWPESQNVWSERDKGLRSDARQFERTGSSTAEWAFTLVKVGEPARAIAMMKPLIAQQRQKRLANKYELARLIGILALADSALGDTPAALAAFRESIAELTRRDQEEAAEHSGYWRTFWRRAIIEGYIELLGTMYLTGSAPADLYVPEEAFRMADLARESSVQAAISASAARAQLPDPELAELVRKDQDALGRIVALNELLARLASGPEAAQSGRAIGDLTKRIAILRAEKRASAEELRRLFPGYADLIDPPVPHLADVRKVLAADEALVSIFVGEKRTLVWTVAQNATDFRVVPVARIDIDYDVRLLRREVEFGNGSLAQLRAFDLERAHRIYRLLLAPSEPIWAKARVLNVVPHGGLGQVPFSLLVTEAPAAQSAPDPRLRYREAAWLARKIAVAQVPSANAFLALRRKSEGTKSVPREPLLAFGDPVFSTAVVTARNDNVRNLTVQIESRDLDGEASAAEPRVLRSLSEDSTTGVQTRGHSFERLAALPDTADEVREIAGALHADAATSVFTGRMASETTVKSLRLDDRRVVVFATHGVAAGELAGVDQPALVLSNPEVTGEKDEDGFLTMDEVLALKLNADWVVLSACNTAASDGRASEAVSGLGRAFFYAGARSLLVSNWAVESTSARLLTTELFKRQSADPNLTRAEALRQAMVALIDRQAVDGSTSLDYAHPAFWAPFSLVGDGY